MRIALFVFVLVIGGLTAGWGVQPKKNLVKNPGFEKGLQSWVAEPTTLSLTVSPNEKHTGSNSLEVPVRDQPGYTARQAVSLQNKHAYAVDAWVKSSEGFDRISLCFDYLVRGEPGRRTLVVSDAVTTCPEWTRISGQIYLAEIKPIIDAHVSVQADMTRCKYFLDDISVQEIQNIPTALVRAQQARCLAEMELRPEGQWAYMIEPGDFPAIRWTQPLEVSTLVGDFPLQVRWFNADRKEVTRAEKPGRYAAIVDGTTPAGIHIRRAVPLYCRASDWHPWDLNPQATLRYLPGGPASRETWETHKELLEGVMGNALVNLFQTKPDGAVILAGLAEMQPRKQQATYLDDPFLLDQDYHVALKLKLMGVAGKGCSLKPPHKRAGSPAPILRVGTPEEAAIKAEAVRRIHEVCQAWYKASGQPFATVLARRGVIFYQESFGDTPDRPINMSTHFPLASLTKLLTGLLFAQFIDQGLIRPDDPVANYLPDFPATGDKMITLRNCLTHTTGLEGHGRWNGPHNPYLENILASLSDSFQPGRMYKYNGMGIDLAGKVMEVAAGKGIYRLFQENFFIPLGMNDLSLYDLAFSASLTAEQLARVGQLMLNRGAYGELEFFSPDTFEQLKPRHLEEIYPALKGRNYQPHTNEYGLGISPCCDWHPEAGKNGHPAGETILSPNTIGHGASSTTVLRVDPDHELVVAMGRFDGGPDYQKHLAEFLIAVRESLANK